MSLLYLDACAIIYLVEAASPFHEVVKERLLTWASVPDARVVTSRLSRLECRVGPLRTKDAAVLALYETFFSSDRMLVVDITSAVIESATDLRVRYGFRTPDAIHVATALEVKASRFLTGDSDLRRCQEIDVEILGA